MSPSELRDWFGFIQEAPDSIRLYLEVTFWILILLLLVWAILKILFNNQFKELYRILGLITKKISSISKVVAIKAVKNLELPEPHPKLTRFFAIMFMANTYAAFFLFTSLFFIFSVLLVLSETVSIFGRMGGIIITLFIGYFAWFSFAQAEQDRVTLFKNNDQSDS